jgi:hypothetical protein
MVSQLVGVDENGKEIVRNEVLFGNDEAGVLTISHRVKGIKIDMEAFAAAVPSLLA